MNTKFESMKLPELQKVAEEYNIKTQRVSEKTGKMINKTKALLIHEIHEREHLYRFQQNEIKKQKEKKQEENHETLIDSLEIDGKKLLIVVETLKKIIYYLKHGHKKYFLLFKKIKNTKLNIILIIFIIFINYILFLFFILSYKIKLMLFCFLNQIIFF